PRCFDPATHAPASAKSVATSRIWLEAALLRHAACTYRHRPRLARRNSATPVRIGPNMFADFDKPGVAVTRWREAQQYEQSFWQRLGDDIEAGTREHLDWYKWRAEQLDHRLSGAFAHRPQHARILEIGSGPIGI